MRKAVMIAGLLLAPRVALACPVCFGQNDSPMASAINMGILLMLGVTGVVLVGFASFFIHLIRRARLAAEPDAGRVGEVGPDSAETGRYVPNV
jgi:hypothetical protein